MSVKKRPRVVKRMIMNYKKEGKAQESSLLLQLKSPW